jgi:hypothetical protein
MLFSEATQLMQHERYLDLLRQAEQERFLAVAFPRPLRRRGARRAAARLLRYAARLALRTSEALSPQGEGRADFEAAGLL